MIDFIREYYILNGNIKFNKYSSNEANDIDLPEPDNLVLLKIDSVSSCFFKRYFYI